MLKMWREEHGLSLREVAHAARSHPEPVGFDYLSRLEHGTLMPSIPKLHTLAGVYRRPLSELVDLYEIEQLRRLVPKRGTYDILRRLGIEKFEKGELTKGLACFLGALDVARREGGDRQRLAIAYNNVGGALVRSERYLMAKGYLEDGLRFVQTVQTRTRLLDNLANVWYHLDNMPLAELFSRESHALAAADPILRPATRATRAAVLQDLERYTEAEQLLREALAEFHETGDEVSEIRQRYNLGDCLVVEGKVEEGISHLRAAAVHAREKKNPELMARSLFFLGRGLYRADRRDEAAGPLASALSLGQESNMRNEAFHSAYYLWRLARENQDSEHERYFEIARQHRTWVQQRSEECAAFDDHLRQFRRPGKTETLSARKA